MLMPDLIIDSPIGQLGFYIEQNKITQIEFDVDTDMSTHEPQALFTQIKAQLDQYFLGQLTKFNLAFQAQGTDFQKKVWAYLLTIPYGTTKNYGEVAMALNSSARAVGNACRKNPLPLLIPCHRVVAKKGIGGFSGATAGHQIDRKLYLLNLECL